MTRPSIVITGANGYLGSCFVRYFIGLNWKVKAFVHHDPVERISEVIYINYSLETELNEVDFVGVTSVIHAAYVRFDKNKDADTINYKGTARLVAVCEKTAIPIVFLSSFSAHDRAISHYGTGKLRCENLFDTARHTILKIGFIIGEGGILREMCQQMMQSQFFPLVGGQQPLQSIGMDDLYKVVATVIEGEHTGVFCIAHQEVWTMKAFYTELATRLDRQLTFVPIPMGFLYRICNIFEFLKIPIPVSSESVLGLKRMTTFDTVNTQKALGFNFKNVVESLTVLELFKSFEEG